MKPCCWARSFESIAILFLWTAKATWSAVCRTVIHLRARWRWWYADRDPKDLYCCHGLRIVDNDELNSYLNYCSHRREYRIWRRKEKGGNLPRWWSGFKRNVGDVIGVTDLAVSASRDDTGLGWNHWITVDGGYAGRNKDQFDIWQVYHVITSVSGIRQELIMAMKRTYQRHARSVSRIRPEHIMDTTRKDI